MVLKRRKRIGDFPHGRNPGFSEVIRSRAINLSDHADERRGGHADDGIRYRRKLCRQLGKIIVVGRRTGRRRTNRSARCP